MRRVLVTGGCGYKGSVLVPKLLRAGHEVRVVDAMWFGKNIPDVTDRLELVQQDIREPVDCKRFDAIIHLAGIANDPCGELDAKLTWEVNVLATATLAASAVKAGVGQFIYASSASIYGIKDNVAVTEEADFAPVSDYNKTKMVAERVLMSHAKSMKIQIIRPATVCGMSPRMRLDTVVNMLTAQALERGAITAHCGAHGAKLMRPNTHIEDITDLYVWMLDRPFMTGAFNAGFENIEVGEIAKRIGAHLPEVAVNVTEVQDKRSYAVSSAKLQGAGFKPRYTVDDAITGIIAAHRGGLLKPGEEHVNLTWMRKHGLVEERP